MQCYINHSKIFFVTCSTDDGSLASSIPCDGSAIIHENIETPIACNNYPAVDFTREDTLPFEQVNSSEDDVGQITEQLSNSISISTATTTLQRRSSRQVQRYNMEHKFRGYLIIFSHQEFKIQGLEERFGTIYDNSNLEETFKLISFCVILHENKTLCEMEELYQKCKCPILKH